MKIIATGRDIQNDVVIRDPKVSQKHMQLIQHDDGRFSVVDLNSKNGTYVNGKRIFTEYTLHTNDTIRIGDTTIPWRDYFYQHAQDYSNPDNVLPITVGIVSGILCIVLIAVFLFIWKDNFFLYDKKDINTQVLIYFTDDMPFNDASSWLKKNKALILDSNEYFRFFFVCARNKKATDKLISCLKENDKVDFAMRNQYVNPCSISLTAIDNFKTIYKGHKITHGEMVATTMNKNLNFSVLEKNIKKTNKNVTTEDISTGIMEICQKMSDTNLNIINISWGVSDSIYDKKVKHNIKKTDNDYIKDYAEDLVEYATIADKCGKQNFIITKSMGNNGVHHIDDAFRLALAHEDMDSAKLNALKEHLIIVAAKDNRFKSEYSNKMRDNVKIDGINTIMVDISNMPDTHTGTSAAAPLVANWIATSGFDKASDVIEAIEKSTQNGELVSEQAFMKTAEKIKNHNNPDKQLSMPEETSHYSSSKFSIDGLLKMYIINTNGELKPKVATYDIDDNSASIVFILDADKALDVTPYLKEGQELLDNKIQSSFMIVSDFNGSKRDFATKFAYKRVRVSGTLHVPMAGWRNTTDIALNLTSINLCDNYAQEEEITIGPNTTYPNIINDLIGQIIYDPSENGYFSKEWRWKIENGEVLDVQILGTEYDHANYENISILAHLHRGSIRIDANMILQYARRGNRQILQSSRVTKLIIPKQKDYSQYIELKMDYDLLPALMLYNNSDMTLFVGLDYSNGEDTNIYGNIVEAHSSQMVAFGNIQSYHIHFAYKK